MAVVTQNAPVLETKPTRQWDAWTREEEESFFGALRQVGKNFEKITSRVQSKNKDQVLWTALPVLQPEQHKAPVRHYYYRVIKRMNRVLDPTLILDAKNSTYVHSAMLRWWSLLEKHSCSASKLRSKPRRFKAFVTALILRDTLNSNDGLDMEHQLLKDHKKVKPKKSAPAATPSKKHASHAEPDSSSQSGLPELVTSGSGDDSQNGPAAGAGRKNASKRKAGIHASQKSGCKGEAKRPPRPRKKAADGNLSKAAYAKWEKEASVGVSLMAEAAEQLERASAANPAVSALEGSGMQSTRSTGGNVVDVDVQTGEIPAGPAAAFAELGLTDKVVNDHPPCGLPSVEARSGQATLSSEPRVYASNPQTTNPSSALTGAHEVRMRDTAIPELCTAGKGRMSSVDTTRCNNCCTLRTSSAEEDKLDLMASKLKLQLFPFDDSIRKALEQDGLNPHLELTLKARKSMSSILHHLVQKWGRCTVAAGELRLFPYNTQWSDVSSCQSWCLKDANVNAAEVHAALGKPTVFRLRYAWLESRVLETDTDCQRQYCVQSGDQVEPRKDQDTSFGAAMRSTINTCTSHCFSTSPMIAVQTTVRATEPSNEIWPDMRGDQPSDLHCNASGPAASKMDNLKTVDVTQTPDAFSTLRSDPLQVTTSTPLHAATPTRSVGRVSREHAGQSEQILATFADRLLENASGEMENAGGEMENAGGEMENASGEMENTGREMENAGREMESRHLWKDAETGSQISGCAWLYENNDGFAQQLWSQEDIISGGHSVPDWVDGLTNISVGELLGEASRAGFPSSLDCLQQSSVQTPLCTMDSFDIAVGGQDLSTPSLPPVGQSCQAIWGGEETCDAFSFQRLDRGSKDAMASFADEQGSGSFGLDVTFGDFRSLTCLKEGDSLAGFDSTLQAQPCRTSDLFDGDLSVGLGGLIEALSQGSLDGFQACIMGQFSQDLEKDLGKRICSVRGEGKTEGGPGAILFCSKDESSQAALTEFCEQGKLDGRSSETIDARNKSESNVPDGTVPPYDTETQRLKSSSPKLSRKKTINSPRKSFRLPRQYNTARSLRLQV